MFKTLKDKIHSYQKNTDQKHEMFFEFSDGIESVEETQFMRRPIERISIRTFFILFVCVLLFLGGYLLYLVVTQGQENLLIAQKKRSRRL